MTRRDRTTGPEGLRLYYMLGAMLHFDQSVFTHMLGMGNTIAVPTPIFLIDHPEGKVLFETGVHRDVVSDAVGHWGEHELHGQTTTCAAATGLPSSRPTTSWRTSSPRLAFTTDDIRYVVQSVLIPDHAGRRARVSPNQPSSFSTASCRTPGTRRPSCPTTTTRTSCRRFAITISGGSMTRTTTCSATARWKILFSPAHSRGEQALVVRLPNTGTVIMPAGVIPQQANWDHGVTTGTPCVDPALCEASMRRLMRIAELEDGMVMFHHDAEHWKTYRMAPEYYD